MKTKMGIVAGLFVTLLSSAALASVGQEGRGGQTVDLNGKPVLRDLVDKTVCDWVDGSSFLPKVTYYPTMLKGLTNDNWRFAEQINTEALALHFCSTQGPLPFIPDSELSGVTVFSAGVRQVAVRLGDDIYLDQSIFGQMTARDQGYLILHEALHAFIGDVPNRMIKLRSFVKFVSDHENSPVTLDAFAYQADRDNVQLPILNDQIQNLRKYFEIIFDLKVNLQNRQMAESIIQDIDPDKNGLATLNYREAILFKGVMDPLVEKIKDIFEKDDVDSLKDLFAEGLNPNYGNPEEGLKTSLIAIAITGCKTKIIGFLLNQPTIDLKNWGDDFDLFKMSIQNHCDFSTQALLKRPGFKLNIENYEVGDYAQLAYKNRDFQLIQVIAVQFPEYEFKYLVPPYSVREYTSDWADYTIYNHQDLTFFSQMLNLRDASGNYRVHFQESSPYSKAFLAGDAIDRNNIEALKILLKRTDLDLSTYVLGAANLLLYAVHSGNVEAQKLILADGRSDFNAIDKGDDEDFEIPHTFPRGSEHIHIKTAVGITTMRAAWHKEDALQILQYFLAKPGIDLKTDRVLEVAKTLLKKAKGDDKILFSKIVAMLAAHGD